MALQFGPCPAEPLDQLGEHVGREGERQAQDALTANGVRFERYDEPLRTDSRGIHTLADGKVAWFKDPDGNTFAVEEQRTQRAR